VRLSKAQDHRRPSRPTPAGGSHAFLYNGGKTFDLGTLGLNTGGYDSVGTAINDQGQVVGYSNVFTVPINRGSTHAFLYSGGRMRDIDTLSTTFYEATWAYGINNSGQVVGLYFGSPTDTTAIDAFIYDSGGMYKLSDLIPPNSGWKLGSIDYYLEGMGINDVGQIVGTGTYKGLSQAYLLTPIK
jgi:probable HAF family extracellular repeat protein